jgi:polyisoprenoid-binding protein YceI
MGLSHFAGRFDKISGTATVNPADLSKSGAVISIDSSSGNTGVAKLDDELDQKDFFDAEKFPAITFTSTKVEVTGKNAAGKDIGKIYGMLSLKGVTKPITLDVTFNGHGPNPMMATQERMGFEASTTIKRSEFGFTYGVPMVSDEVELIIAAEFTKA